AVLEPGAVAVLDQAGTLVRRFRFSPADVSAARLDGGRLVVWRFGVLEAYDVASGAKLLSRPMPTGYRLADVDGGIAVLLSPDGSRLTPLYPRGSMQDGLAISGDGRTIAYEQPNGEGISVSRADGTARRVLTRDGSSPALTRDGKRLAFAFGSPRRVALVGAD